MSAQGDEFLWAPNFVQDPPETLMTNSVEDLHQVYKHHVGGHGFVPGTFPVFGE